MTVNTMIEGTVDSASRSPRAEDSSESGIASSGYLSFNSLLNGVSLPNSEHEGRRVTGPDNSVAGAIGSSNTVLLTGVGLITFMGFSGIPLDLTGDKVCLLSGDVKEHRQGVIKNGAALLVSLIGTGMEISDTSGAVETSSKEAAEASADEDISLPAGMIRKLPLQSEWSNGDGHWAIKNGAAVTGLVSQKDGAASKVSIGTSVFDHAPQVALDNESENLQDRDVLSVDRKGFLTLQRTFYISQPSEASSARSVFSEGVDVPPINPNAAGIRSQSQRDLSVSSGSGQLTNKDNDKPLELNASNITVENIFLHVNSRNNADSLAEVRPPKEHIAADTVFDDTLMKTRVDDTSLRVSAEPPGIGKLDIELVLHKGLINGQINVFDTVGKEAIERNLYGIVNMLIKDGLSIGGLSVFLRDGRGQEDGGMNEGTSRLHKETRSDAASSSSGVINIYV